METENTELDDKNINDNNIDDLDEILKLLNQTTNEDTANSDIQAISDLLNSVDNNSDSNNMHQGSISDVGDVFSDALKSVSDINVPTQDKKNLNVEEQAEEVNLGKKGKNSFLSKIFAKKDSKKEDSDKISEKEEAASNIEGLDKSLAATEQVSSKSKKKKAKKGTKVKNKLDAADEKAKSKGKKAKNAKKDQVKKAKKVKAVKKIVAEEEVDIGKINPISATFVFTFCGILLLAFLIKGRQYTYSLNIGNADKYFNNKEYARAFNEVYGVEVKDEDVATYNKIMTVMYVEKQLASYKNYYALEKYPEALASLLKGLQRYDKYIELATIIGIEEDLNNVRDTIVAELNDVFNLSEEEAMQIIRSADQDNEDMYSAKLDDFTSKITDKN